MWVGEELSCRRQMMAALTFGWQEVDVACMRCHCIMRRLRNAYQLTQVQNLVRIVRGGKGAASARYQSR